MNTSNGADGQSMCTLMRWMISLRPLKISTKEKREKITDLVNYRTSMVAGSHSTSNLHTHGISEQGPEKLVFLGEYDSEVLAFHKGYVWLTNQLPCEIKPRKRTSIPPKLRYQILKRDGYRCQLCGRTAQDKVVLHIDHRQPLAGGGDNSPENLWVLCEDCNLGKGTDNL